MKLRKERRKTKKQKKKKKEKEKEKEKKKVQTKRSHWNRVCLDRSSLSGTKVRDIREIVMRCIQ
jgi:hypothetical protein